jgi:uncharacterized RDD family membrane protein YckC
VSLLAVPGYIVLLAGPKEEFRCDSDTSRNATGSFICEGPTGGTTAIAFLLFGLAAVAGIAYYIVYEGRGQTIGKKAVGIRVADAMSGAPIGPGRAAGRYFARILSALPCYLGYFWMLWDENKQTWHDKLVNSIVVRD